MTVNAAPSRWSLSYTGNRVLLAVVLAWLAWFALGSIALGAVIGVITFAIATAVVAGRNRSVNRARS